MKKLLFILLMLSAAGPAGAQFIRAGKIEFERRTNQHSFLEEESMWDEMVKENLPQFAVTYFDLVFDEKKSIYQSGRDPDYRKIHWALTYITNTVYKDEEKSVMVTQKNIFGSDYLITDSLHQIEWKITSEPRTIAGFECRKAVGKVFDSVVVIAFYTDEILPPNGPESFGGLPGMILGLAIPRLHTTWYATKLEIIEDPSKQIIAPKDGRKFTGDQFQKEMLELIKTRDWLKKISFQMLI